MNAAIWGAGFIAQTHAAALKANGINIVAVVDRKNEKARSFAQKWNIPSYGENPSILYGKDVDVVHVCTPPSLHYGMVMSLLEKGKNVLCEKPLCFSNEEAEAMERKAKKNGLLCAVNLNVRFHMACQKAKQVVSDPGFGRIMLVHGNYLQEYNAFPAPLDWRYNETLAGSMRAVTEIGTHWMDIAQYISGKRVTAVSAQFGRFYPERYLENNMMYTDSKNGTREQICIRSEDAAMINIRFEDGAMGSVVLSEISQGRMNRITLEVTGENRNLWWNSEDNNMLNTSKKGDGVNTEIFGFGNGFMDTFSELIGQYYKALNGNAVVEHPVYPTFEDGANLVFLCNAILKSAENDSKWVTVENCREIKSC